MDIRIRAGPAAGNQRDRQANNLTPPGEPPVTGHPVPNPITMAGMGADIVICTLGACTILAGILWQLHAKRHYAGLARPAVRKGRRLPTLGTVGVIGAGTLILTGLFMAAVALIL
jgi:hypothetical protein